MLGMAVAPFVSISALLSASTAETRHHFPSRFATLGSYLLLFIGASQDHLSDYFPDGFPDKTALLIWPTTCWDTSPAPFSFFVTHAIPPYGFPPFPSASRAIYFVALRISSHCHSHMAGSLGLGTLSFFFLTPFDSSYGPGFFSFPSNLAAGFLQGQTRFFARQRSLPAAFFDGTDRFLALLRLFVTPPDPNRTAWPAHQFPPFSPLPCSFQDLYSQCFPGFLPSFFHDGQPSPQWYLSFSLPALRRHPPLFSFSESLLLIIFFWGDISFMTGI